VRVQGMHHSWSWGAVNRKFASDLVRPRHSRNHLSVVSRQL
jgi:hypothetical protein